MRPDQESPSAHVSVRAMPTTNWPSSAIPGRNGPPGAGDKPGMDRLSWIGLRS
jgi:hypothetical protein